MALELERFKREINLVEYARSCGYDIDSHESSSAAVVLQAGSHRVMVATNAEDGHGIYFSLAGQTDHGSVIDFAQKRQPGRNLGHIRKDLRGWLPGVASPSSKQLPPAGRFGRPMPVGPERAKVLAKWAGLGAYRGSGLSKQHGLDPDLVRYWGVREDERGHAVFAHRDELGVCGWEVEKGSGAAFVGWPKLGIVMPEAGSVRRIVVVESGIEAISHAQLYVVDKKETLYVSLGGTLREHQAGLLGGLLQSHAKAVLVVATGADLAGEDLAKRIGRVAPKGMDVQQQPPDEGSTGWNDVLRVLEEVDRDRENRRGLGM